jgi:hypothetical protein
MSWEVKIIDDVPVKIHNVVVYKFRISDSEEPDLYAAEPIWNWQESEMGQWVMENAVDKPIWERRVDHNTYGYQYAILAKLREADYLIWALKWGT